MKPVHQNQFGGPDELAGVIGNCYPACVASLLEVELDQVPHFYELHADSEAAMQAKLDYLHSQGFTLMYFDWAPWALQYLPIGSLFIGTGRSPRGPYEHAIVCERVAEGAGWRLAHDPHPDGTGVVGELIGFTILIPIMSAGWDFGREIVIEAAP